MQEKITKYKCDLLGLCSFYKLQYKNDMVVVFFKVS